MLSGGRVRASLCCVGVSLAGLAIAPHQRTPLSDLLQRAGAYVADYERRFSALVAEERYVQQVRTGARDVRGGPTFEARDVADGVTPTTGGQAARHQKQTGPTYREMRSDVLMVQLPDRTWFGLRDVIEVDSHTVRDREGRLQELFLKAQSNARRIVDESARYNIGPVTRNTNVPTFALVLLAPDVQYRFAFDKVGEEQVDGQPTWVIGFEEISEPTIVKDDRDRNMPSSGRFWIVPRTGHVLRTEVTAGNEKTDARGRTRVTYGLNPALGVLVPVEMKELYDLPSRPWDPYVECTARYSNFRRFQVTTDETVKVPK